MIWLKKKKKKHVWLGICSIMEKTWQRGNQK